MLSKNVFKYSLLLCYFWINGVWSAVRWENIKCAADTEQAMPEGRVEDIARFPWFGVVQHSFYLGGKTRFAVTSGVLVHPSYAIAPAEDISRIDIESLRNNTRFIVWESKSLKYSLMIDTYYLSPEYTEGETMASLALLQISTHKDDESRAPVLPVCLATKGGGEFSDLYAVKMTDDAGEVEKEIVKMNYMDSQDCAEFYYKHNLNYKKMAPKKPICAKASNHSEPCVWDGGAALITRQSWGFWKLLGFSVRGPGCGAPTRFINIYDHLLWIDEVISQVPYKVREEDQAFIFRRVSPIELVLYKAKVKQPRDIGMCDRKTRGQVIYKDNSELITNKNFAQGFFFVSVAQVAQVNCVTVILDVNARTNAAVWMEHHCHQDLTGAREGFMFKDWRQYECYVYFKSIAFIEFRFYFSFKAMLEVTMYGREEVPRFIPNPFVKYDSTYNWHPTFSLFRENYFIPHYSWWWSM